ncbi:hypothetical protein ACXN1G_23775 [Rhodococcus ruber]
MTRTVDVPADLREATAELVAATRALMLAAATTTADADTVRAARATIAELAETLGSRPRPRVLRPPFDGPSRSRDTGGREPWALFTHNPMGIPLEIHFGADEARAGWSRTPCTRAHPTACTAGSAPTCWTACSAPSCRPGAAVR